MYANRKLSEEDESYIHAEYLKIADFKENESIYSKHYRLLLIILVSNVILIGIEYYTKAILSEISLNLSARLLSRAYSHIHLFKSIGSILSLQWIALILLWYMNTSYCLTYVKLNAIGILVDSLVKFLMFPFIRFRLLNCILIIFFLYRACIHNKSLIIKIFYVLASKFFILYCLVTMSFNSSQSNILGYFIASIYFAKIIVVFYFDIIEVNLDDPVYFCKSSNLKKKIKFFTLYILSVLIVDYFSYPTLISLSWALAYFGALLGLYIELKFTFGKNTFLFVNYNLSQKRLQFNQVDATNSTIMLIILILCDMGIHLTLAETTGYFLRGLFYFYGAKRLFKGMRLTNESIWLEDKLNMIMIESFTDKGHLNHSNSLYLLRIEYDSSQ